MQHLLVFLALHPLLQEVSISPSCYPAPPDPDEVTVFRRTHGNISIMPNIKSFSCTVLSSTFVEVSQFSTMSVHHHFYLYPTGNSQRLLLPVSPSPPEMHE